ncbi:hypothetical protein K402DRAFT_343954, partial [Aulographum hederae CBS 113979]
VNKLLKGSWCVAEAERHHHVFKKSPSCREGGLFLISWGYPEFVECRDDIELGVMVCLTQLSQGFLNERWRVPVFDRDGVQRSIVYANTESSIGFLDHQDRCSVGTGAWSDEAFPQHFVDIRLDHCSLIAR